MTKLTAFAFAAAALVAATAASPAAAQGIPFAPGISVHAGVVAGTDKVTVEDDSNDFEQGASGLAYGAVGGVDVTLPGGLFLGAEAEWSDSSVDESETGVLAPGDEAIVEAGSNVVLSGRIGMSFPGGIRVYARGGYSKASFFATYDDGVTVQGGEDKLGGWVAGGGAELRFGKLVARAEYRIAEYGDIVVGPGSSGINVSRNQLTAGLLFAF